MRELGIYRAAENLCANLTEGLCLVRKRNDLSWAHERKVEGVEEEHNPLLSDVSHNIGEAYGVMNRDTGFHLRGTYIIDPSGVVRHLSMNDPPAGRNVDEVLRLVQAYQFADKHGEVCPTGWAPGKDTIQTDPISKKKFFAKNARDE